MLYLNRYIYIYCIYYIMWINMAGFSRKSPGPQPGARPVGASKRIAGCSARCRVKWGSYGIIPRETTGNN